ncbi:MAG: hypothetical protein H0W21_13410 [Actinobacteria bacterium]|nr:hypothetical protein [Actinomycetota bacterium]
MISEGDAKPYINGRPLLDSRPDQSLYVRRPHEEDVVRSAIRRSLNTLVLGARGSGKTSFLRALAYVLRSEGVPVAFVEGGAPTDAGALVELISRRVGEVSGRAPDGDRRPGGVLLEAVRGLQSVGDPERRMVVLMDGLPSAADAHALFGRLRDELWRLPFTWVVATDDDDRAALLTPPADAFFELVVELRQLQTSQQDELLRKRGISDAASLADQGNGNPRDLLALARLAAADGSSPAALAGAQLKRRAEAQRLGRPAEMVVAELEASGPLSASDERLLRRLGWTRERAVQVLRQLEAAGLVTTSLQKGPSGRPRKLYGLHDRTPSG